MTNEDQELNEMMAPKKKRVSKDKTFAEVAGVPANEHKRARAREDKEVAKSAAGQNRKVFFTMNGHKFVRVDVKKNGAYYTYLGRLKKDLGHAERKAETAHWELEKKKWAEKGPWLHAHEAEEKIHEAIEELNK